MGVKVHPTALVDKSVELGDEVTVGPYAIVQGRTTIGRGTVIENHATIGWKHGRVVIGSDNHFGPSCIVGGPPQDLSYKGEETELHIGNGNNIREFATLNLGTPKGGGNTRIGDRCLLMAYVHIAHDCVIGNGVVIANATQLAGHVELGDGVRVGGVCKFVQFVRVGRMAYIGGDSTLNKDVLPFSIAEGRWATMRATNKVGLERAGLPPEEIVNIHRAIKKVIRGSLTREEALAAIESDCQPSPAISEIVSFIKSSEKGLAR
jgi:UDP-N-acetylglucosamine acyltransferase